jgi:hypothetical protein
MTEATTDFYLPNFAPFEKAVAKNGRAWTQLLRQAAISRFAELRFPTTRCVAWKHSHVAPTTRIPFSPPTELHPMCRLTRSPPLSPNSLAQSWGFSMAMTCQSCWDCRCYRL